MVLLGALSALGPLSMDLYLPALPTLEREFDAGQSATQLTLTAVALGLALGQLVVGPLSDRLGRRVPVLVGVGAYALASLLCALSPDVWVLSGIRLLQGVAGAAGIVLARAVVRDRLEGAEAARAFAVLASIMGAAPVLAPVAGAQLLRFTDWRGVFVALTGIGVVLFLATLWRMPETLPPERRVAGGFRTTARNARRLLARRAFVGAVLAQGLGFGTLFTYISSSSFVLQSGQGLSAQQFGLVFAVNGIGIVLAGQVSRLLVRRLGSRTLLVTGLSVEVVGSAVLLVGAMAGAGLPLVLPMLFLVVSANGLVLPNATALAMADAARMAGTASALVGTAQFALPGLGAPLAGFGTPGTLLPMAAVMVGFAATGWLAAVVLTRERAPAGRDPGEVPAAA
ncbi:multidrug effflux MFS transporter [Modestobacter roseus]|uniref:DHA1 family bicyclomycin/chloramphenicol resistance-like MFS transporter n=1 Tax=Modestobacter roseus TaxID=1181884 RepID=A0A562IT99_9ACTN|nr:multidrug effflux MFS transporter [Modestobacter roseus]MQA34843.1 Bcr/CflA family efflux MFS transporter [Modestobacter roseus]TWH74056.1 DHA1 family bicyclomycin/chloramphenicol resistance-like MFS transporter [Modestobacter roseus]